MQDSINYQWKNNKSTAQMWEDLLYRVQKLFEKILMSNNQIIYSKNVKSWNNPFT